MAATATSPPGATAQTTAAVAGGVVFRGAVYGGSGYADGNLDVLSSLQDLPHPLQLAPLGLQEDHEGLLPPARQRELARLQRRRLDLAQSVFYQCCPALDFATHLEARVRVGRTAFETNSLPPGWRERCNALDQIWVPSQFNRDSFLRAGVDEHRLRVMPEGLDTGKFRPGLAPLPIPGRRGYAFLSIFDWIDRKGPDVLLRAFLSAFTADDDVSLILKIHKFDDPNADLEGRLLHFIEREAGVPLQRAPHILVLRGLLPKADMPRLYASADAFVLPSRGEGWGRPYMEAAATQLPVLATRWSGHLDFLHDDNSYLIDIEGVVPAPRDSDRDVYIGQGWAEPSVEHLAALMRQVVSQREEAQARARRARQEMVALWDTQVMARRWTRAFRELLD
ncbi:MAG TPA: glycosyltransferase [Terriglobales bacterium]|nr:glycosyltransferase [Terriglobales bacterium]